MKHLFVPYSLALLAKEKGFDEECFCWYDCDGKINHKTSKSLCGIRVIDCHTENTIAPLYQQLVDWFREKHNIKVVESPQFGWDIYQPCDNEWILATGGQCTDLTAALTEAFTLITPSPIDTDKQ